MARHACCHLLCCFPRRTRIHIRGRPKWYGWNSRASWCACALQLTVAGDDLLDSSGCRYCSAFPSAQEIQELCLGPLALHSWCFGPFRDDTHLHSFRQAECITPFSDDTLALWGCRAVVLGRPAKRHTACCDLLFTGKVASFYHTIC